MASFITKSNYFDDKSDNDFSEDPNDPLDSDTFDVFGSEDEDMEMESDYEMHTAAGPSVLPNVGFSPSKGAKVTTTSGILSANTVDTDGDDELSDGEGVDISLPSTSTGLRRSPRKRKRPQRNSPNVSDSESDGRNDHENQNDEDEDVDNNEPGCHGAASGVSSSDGENVQDDHDAESDSQPQRNRDESDSDWDSDDERPLAGLQNVGRGRGRGHQRMRDIGNNAGNVGAQGGAGRGRGRGQAQGRRGGGRGGGRAQGGRDRRQAPMKWKKTRTHVPQIFPFNVQPGLNPVIRDGMPQNPTPADFVELFTTNNFIDKVVTETNHYARQLIDGNIANNTLKRKSRLRKWSDTNRGEMKKFFGILIMTGLIKKGTYNEYWAKDGLLYTPAFSSIMSRDRFILLKRCLHFNDNEDPNFDPTAEDRDRLHKIRPMIDTINERCQLVYIPDKHITVDESLILFRGRLIFKQTIRTKRARVGVKLYPLCTSDGITLGLRIYSAQNIPYEDVNVPYQFTTSEQIVLNLVEPYFDKGYEVFTDNYYTSPQLASYLHLQGTHLSGTIRPNRHGYPTQEMAGENLDLGQIVNYVSEDNKLLAVKYREARDRASGQPKIVHMLTTAHDISTVDTGRRTRRDLPIIKPKCVSQYNQHMGGVDLTDQQLGLQSLCPMKKTLKWYHKVAVRLLLQMILNGHKIYRKEVPVTRKHTLWWFAGEVARKWTGFGHHAEVDVDPNQYRLNNKMHVPGMPEVTGKSGSNQSECRVCNARGHKKSVTLVCQTCPQHPRKWPGLCHKPCPKCAEKLGEDLNLKTCWEVWHSQRDITIQK